jgi:hypothetical protein
LQVHLKNTEKQGERKNSKREKGNRKWKEMNVKWWEEE